VSRRANAATCEARKGEREEGEVRERGEGEVRERGEGEVRERGRERSVSRRAHAAPPAP